MSLFHHHFQAVLLGGLNQEWTEYNEWPLSKSIGAPDNKMIQILLNAAEGQRLDINQNLLKELQAWNFRNHDDKTITEDKCQPEALRWISTSHWRALLELLTSTECNVMDHADEWLEILRSFLNKRANRTELEQVMERLKSAFKTAGDDKLQKFLAITREASFGAHSTVPESFSLFDDPIVEFSEEK